MLKPQVRAYLLNIGEFLEEERGESLCARAAEWLDDTRREKVERCRQGRARAAAVGAGLLLQLGMQELSEGEDAECRSNPEGEDAVCRGNPESEDAECRSNPEGEDAVCRSNPAGGAAGGRVLWQELTVTGLLGRLRVRSSLTYTYGEKGKPFLQGCPWYFSLSHSGDYVLCAFSRREVGADLQRIESVDTGKLAGRFFAAQECKALEACGTERSGRRLFFELWARKEALGKLTGQGLAGMLGRNMLEGGAEEPEWLEVPAPEGYAAAVCLRGKEISFTGVEQWDD